MPCVGLRGFMPADCRQPRAQEEARGGVENDNGPELGGKMLGVKILGIGIKTANALYKAGWRFTILGALITLAGSALEHAQISTVGALITLGAVASLMWGTFARDRHAEREIAQLREETSWRSLTAAQRAEIVRALKEDPPALKLWGYAIPPEAANYADQVAQPLREAGCKLEYTQCLTSPIHQNLITRSPSSSRIVDAFAAAGIAFLTDPQEHADPTPHDRAQAETSCLKSVVGLQGWRV